jgi:hypothetical protein
VIEKTTGVLQPVNSPSRICPRAEIDVSMRWGLFVGATRQRIPFLTLARNANPKDKFKYSTRCTTKCLIGSDVRTARGILREKHDSHCANVDAAKNKCCAVFEAGGGRRRNHDCQHPPADGQTHLCNCKYATVYNSILGMNGLRQSGQTTFLRTERRSHLPSSDTRTICRRVRVSLCSFRCV